LPVIDLHRFHPLTRLALSEGSIIKREIKKDLLNKRPFPPKQEKALKEERDH